MAWASFENLGSGNNGVRAVRTEWLVPSEMQAQQSSSDEEEEHEWQSLSAYAFSMELETEHTTDREGPALRCITIDFDASLMCSTKGGMSEDGQKGAMSLPRNKAEDSRLLSCDKWWEHLDLKASLRDTHADHVRGGYTSGGKASHPWTGRQVGKASLCDSA